LGAQPQTASAVKDSVCSVNVGRLGARDCTSTWTGAQPRAQRQLGVLVQLQDAHPRDLGSKASKAAAVTRALMIVQVADELGRDTRALRLSAADRACVATMVVPQVVDGHRDQQIVQFCSDAFTNVAPCLRASISAAVNC